MGKYANLNEIISENLIYYRKKAGLTQSQLAEKLNYSDKSVSKWERGESIPDVLVLAQLAELYGLSVNDFLSKKKKEMIGNFYFSKAMVYLLSSSLLWVVATIAFFIVRLTINSNQDYLVFIYTVPLNCILVIVFNDIFLKRYFNIYPSSILLWSLITALYLSFDFDLKYLLFIIGIPIQVLLGLTYLYFYRKAKKS